MTISKPAALAAALSLLCASGTAFAQGGAPLSGPAAFAGAGDDQARSIALFTEMGKVLQHPRCVNCHPAGERPLQDADMKLHVPPVVRGPDGFGAVGMRCATCHGAENVAFVTGEGSIPGNPKWQLAPLEMAWEKQSLAAICGQLKDPERNGGKTLAELVEHNAHDELVAWGWDPGEGREPAPGTQAIFGELTKAWVDSGAHCPTE